MFQFHAETLKLKPQKPDSPGWSDAEWPATVLSFNQDLWRDTMFAGLQFQLQASPSVADKVFVEKLDFTSETGTWKGEIRPSIAIYCKDEKKAALFIESLGAMFAAFASHPEAASTFPGLVGTSGPKPDDEPNKA